mgnify:FL=1
MGDSIDWADGEQEKFRSRLFPEEMSYYVDADVVARCRDSSLRLGQLRGRPYISRERSDLDVA